VDFVSKPRGEPVTALERLASEIVSKVKTAASANIPGSKHQRTRVDASLEERQSADVILCRRPPGRGDGGLIIAVGASTGGTEAIKELLLPLPAGLPPMVITQHIPAAFSAPFAKRMNNISRLEVCEAQDGQPILPGHVYIAPGNRHLLVNCSGGGYRCQLHDGPRVNRHKPSVDVLFRSVAQCAGRNAIGVLLTGMGDDGARCLLEMREAGAPTICQDEESSVVWGMPGSAVKRGAADKVLPLQEIPAALQQLLLKMNYRSPARSSRSLGSLAGTL
jgi:two-component system chemotaxis response regulator CheB